MPASASPYTTTENTGLSHFRQHPVPKIRLCHRIWHLSNQSTVRFGLISFIETNSTRCHILKYKTPAPSAPAYQISPSQLRFPSRGITNVPSSRVQKNTENLADLDSSRRRLNFAPECEKNGEPKIKNSIFARKMRKKLRTYSSQM